MASKIESSLSNKVAALLLQHIPIDDTLGAEEKEEQKQAFLDLAEAVIALVEKERAKAAPVAVPVAAKKFVFKAPVAPGAKPAAEAGMTKTGKALTNYQRFVQVFAQAWKDTKGESDLAKRMVTPIQNRPPGASKSISMLHTLVAESAIQWGEEQSFGSLIEQVRAHAPDRLVANGVCWLMLDDASRAAVCE